MLYDVNLGIRDYFTYTDAMLNNSLFSYFLMKNGLDVYKGESTRDVICLDFDFGSRSYAQELKRLEKLRDDCVDDDMRIRIQSAIERVQSNKDLYNPRSRDAIREFFYENGVDVTYKKKDKTGNVVSAETIHYKMLFRTSAKAKLGQVIFINETLYDKAYEWLTMGLGSRMSSDNAKIVEISAYAPLTTSNIVGSMEIPVEDILILQDQDSFFTTMANIVCAEEYRDKKGTIRKRCKVVSKETQVKNTLWDGMALIESAILPDWISGMVLLRNHMFKACAFRTHIQKFFRDWCASTGNDYETYQVSDMFGRNHYLRDIKMITTDNAIKWKKFRDLMGEDPYEYWCDRIRLDGNVWGIVKTDHPSKLGNYQQLSYQMVNTLPCSRDEIKDVAQVSIDYVERLKSDNDEFERFLRKYANEVNHYEMLADLYAQNHDFGNSTFFRREKSLIINQYVFRLRKGKIMVEGDNLTCCGNPYGLLLYTVGEDWQNDPTLRPEHGAIQCYTRRFYDDSFLCAFRNPHNSPNNICYLHNVYSEEMEKYFDFSKNIIAVNCIETDVQSRCNGMDFDSDFLLVTNQPTMVKAAEYCYRYYPTIVNALKESGITYKNTKADYARMDNKFSKSQMGIGYSSNLAQLAMTYYWTELEKPDPDEIRLKELYDNFVILSVLAQVLIDSCKREYEIDGNVEIERIANLECMKLNKHYVSQSGKVKSYKCDFPEFMKYTREIKYTKDGKELPHEEISEMKNKLKRRINKDLVCPMNWLEYWLDKIQGASTSATTPTEDFFIKMKGKGNSYQITKVILLIEELDNDIKYLTMDDRLSDEEYNTKVNEVCSNAYSNISKIRINNIITINRLIETALALKVRTSRETTTDKASKYCRKILNALYKSNKEKFLLNFVSK